MSPPPLLRNPSWTRNFRSDAQGFSNSLVAHPQSDAAMDGVADRLRAGGAVEEEVGACVIRKPRRPPYSNQLWFPIVGTTVPVPVTVATMPVCVPNDCTKPPLMLASTLLPNRCVH